MQRPCLSGCGRLIRSGSRCGPCARAAHPSPSLRGYGRQHRAVRAELVAMLPLPCAYGCGTVLRSAAEMVAAHVVDGRPEAGYLASCRTCNERAKVRGHGGAGPARVPGLSPDTRRPVLHPYNVAD